MLLYGVAIATGPFQCKGMWSAAGRLGGNWGCWGGNGGLVGEDVCVCVCVKNGGCELPERKERVNG